MILIDQKHEFVEVVTESGLLRPIELAARTCYKSEDHIGDLDKTRKFVGSLVERKHEAMLEFAHITVKFITNRGVTHELVRHRIASYAQESTRYCNYGKEKFGNQLTFIRPSWCTLELGEYKVGSSIKFDIEGVWLRTMLDIEKAYLDLTKFGMKPDQVRGVLPNDIKTEIICKMNVRELRHMLKLRTSNAAHPDIRILMTGLLNELKEVCPTLFSI